MPWLYARLPKPPLIWREDTEGPLVAMLFEVKFKLASGGQGARQRVSKD